MDKSTKDFYIGLILAISSSIFIGSSFIVKKKGLMKLSIRAGSGGYGYLKEWLWWAGLILMGIGEAANFVAYAFAPATLVTPLGALSVLFSSFLASRLLNEKLNILGKIGCFISLLGATFVVLHSPKEQEIKSMEELQEKVLDPGFLSYAIVVVLVGIFFMLYLAPRQGHHNPLVYVSITGTFGSLSVVACKGLGTGIKQILSGDVAQLGHWLMWVMLFCLVAFVSVQMVYLNMALDLFNTAVVTPLLYVVFTGCVILASGILFREWATLTNEDIVGNLCGFVTIIMGIFLLQAFKDITITGATNLMSRRPRKESKQSDTKSLRGGGCLRVLDSPDSQDSKSLGDESGSDWNSSTEKIEKIEGNEAYTLPSPYYYTKEDI